MQMNALTPLQNLIEGGTEVKLELIQALQKDFQIRKLHCADIRRADEALRLCDDSRMKTQFEYLRAQLLQVQASYLATSIMLRTQLRAICDELNRQYVRQIPMHKRVTLLLDFDQMICELELNC